MLYNGFKYLGQKTSNVPVVLRAIFKSNIVWKSIPVGMSKLLALLNFETTFICAEEVQVIAVALASALRTFLLKME